MTSDRPDPLDRPLQISLISQWYAPEFGDGGIPRNIATALRNRGHEVDVLTGFPNYPEGRLHPGYRLRPYQREMLDRVAVHRAPLYMSHDTSAIRRAANYMSFAAASTAVGLVRLPRADVSLVYSSPITAALPAIALKRSRRTPYVLLIQDMWPQSVTASGLMRDAHRVERALHRFCDWIYRGAAAIAVTSPGMMDLIADRGIAQEKLHFVPNWADETNYRPAPRDEAFKDELGLRRPFNVMYAGNLGEVQRLDVVLDAAQLLTDRADIGFVFVGHGAAERSLRERAAANRLTNLTFLPVQAASRMANLLATADVQLVSLNDDPLFRRTLPSKVQSLLAAGQPILGIVEGDAAHVISASGAGVTVSPGSATELAAKIAQIRDRTPDELAAMGRAGREHYLEKFAADVGIRRLEALIRGAVQQPVNGQPTA